ncbi:MAG: hypothetical protein WCA37_05435 [Terracidiphilus sp.]
MMEALERYLEAVGRYLRGSRREDIVAELRANLEAQLEDKEAELGRTLTQQEADAWLKQLGAPVQMAARYQPQRHLIGPEMFPIYWLVMERAIGWAAAIYAIVSAVTIATGTPNTGAVVEALMRLPGVLLWVAAWVTLIFAMIEYGAARNPQEWQGLAERTADWAAGGLQSLDKTGGRGKRQRTLVHATAETILGFLFLVWLLLIPRYPWLLMGPGALLWKASPYQLGPVWITFYWWVVVVHTLQLAWLCIELLRKTWQRDQRVRHALVRVLELIPVGTLLTAPEHVLVMLRNPAADAGVHGANVAVWNDGLHTAVTLIFMLMALQLAWWVTQMGLNRLRDGAR